MIEYLEGIDRWIVLAVNGCHNPILDEFMWIISQRITWLPLYLFLLWLGWKKLNREEFIYFVSGTILAVIFADVFSVHLFKNVFERYRPSHHELLTHKLHFYLKANGELYKGGMYGFVSSHSANFFALATSITLYLKGKVRYIGFVMFFVAGLVAFSRLYQGVHYLSDLIGGAMLGILLGWTFYKISLLLNRKG